MPGSLRPLHPWDVLLTGPDPDVCAVGLAVPLSGPLVSGPLALTAPSTLDLAGLAVADGVHDRLRQTAATYLAQR